MERSAQPATAAGDWRKITDCATPAVGKSRHARPVADLTLRRRYPRAGLLLAQALDGDELITGGGAVGHRNGARDLVAINLAEGCRSNVIA
jgi:hypothetical protein